MPGDAHAQLNPCAPRAPAPRRPDTGVPGWFASPPVESSAAERRRPSPEDLFATYGTAGLWWPSWDLGCSGSAEGLVTDMANVPMDWMSADVERHRLGPADRLGRRLARARWTTPWPPSTERLRSFYGVAMGLALAAVGVWMLFRARTAEYGEITTAGGWAVLMIALAAVALSYPAWAGRTYDDVVIGSAKVVNDTIAGEDRRRRPTIDPAVAQINGDVAYRVWLRGMFGSDSTRTAEVFGPRFYSAMAFAWSELPTLDRGGPEAEALVERAPRGIRRRRPRPRGRRPERLPDHAGQGCVLDSDPDRPARLGAGHLPLLHGRGGGRPGARRPARSAGAWSWRCRSSSRSGRCTDGRDRCGSSAAWPRRSSVVLITATIAGGHPDPIGRRPALESDWPLWLVGFVSLVATYVAWRSAQADRAPWPGWSV